MSTRELILLSPYRLPTHTTLYLADDEVAAFLEAWSALWHPRALQGAIGLPRLASPYDHEQPSAGHIYAVPASPPLMLPDDWEQRVRAVGAAVFRATGDRTQTLANLHAALASLPSPVEGVEGGEAPPTLPADLDSARVGPFRGIGFGYLLLEALFEAMSHDNVLAHAELLEDIRAAVAALSGPEPDSFRQHLQTAANRLLSAREVVYAVVIHVVDLALADPAKSPPWPLAGSFDQPWNLLACTSLLRQLGEQHPEWLTRVREGWASDRLEVVGGPWIEREDPLLPLESQLWNLLRGQAGCQEILGREVRVFGRRRFGFHPVLPLLLQNMGMSHALLVAFDDAILPSHRGTVVSWPSPDGKQVEAFTRSPLAADSPQTYFHLAHYLHETIMQDQAATLALVHKGGPPAPWYEDWLELTRFAPVLGRWTTLSGYFNEVLTGDYTSASSPDEFHTDYLSERASPVDPGVDPSAGPVRPPTPFPVSGFSRQVRGRRKLDATWTLGALLRGIKGALPERDGVPFETWVARLEDRFETEGVSAEELADAQHRAALALADRLLSRATDKQPGFLLLNPCSFTRRVALELPNLPEPLPLTGPLKACQVEGDVGKVVVEVPALGFAWLPRSAPGGSTPGAGRMRLADQRCVRNEFLEAEVDPQTGGLKALRDQKTRTARLGQQLVFNPGSTMRCQQVRTVSTGPALGEIQTEGILVDEQGETLATFTQRFRAWIGRPLLDLRIEIRPVRHPEGYAWHAYYGARFAWRDERASLFRGSNGIPSVTSHTRPETPDYLEVRLGRQNGVIFPGGLPFHQRHGSRMVDVLLITPGETEQVFDLGLGIDREHPMQTALGIVSPLAVVPVDRGPPHIGATGWLFHIDAPHLLLSTLRPIPDADAVVARLFECTGYGTGAAFRCARDPVRALVLDARGNTQYEPTTEGDTVHIEVAPHDLFHLRVEFS